MNRYKKRVDSPDETMEFAKRLGTLLQAGDVITLEGDLGAGKTHFTKGLAKGLGVKRIVNSPTFTIIKEYEGRLPLYHMDVYRLDEDGEEDIGLYEYFYGEGITVIEWASKISEQLPAKRLDITIRHAGSEKRHLLFEPQSEHFEQLCKELVE
ncbi:tRNA (adenosine(37)-N6)-threonylcarbamoyltransferase complex ATPase subunit type 1 TsaE [Alkalicoccobacillus plakortidis]|uniref:tRNA threonylcarbamoyladenosine biosynthesis protein TsaE n=1 Tax=Alkalicoccobacillus plakortidis TaxID=444060 RepID=A0ABT0XMH1_9BACI|nr:tRNA (adenosine(37)-N6)-threonylcarbamoyltransferase complex ATPase subunit type 1 TsaE [Alkalicoccobacillus plakortidis]MCM2677017.1 tRNA (adenosine(37)-N6)-threonylcarbamoyltransferase complex ATPase subunit type 1 TsaE [Alkalicoccobacillus plakortidis]